MKKLNFILIICLCGMFTSCIVRDKTYCINYQSIRQKYAQPTKEEPIPEEAKIVVAYNITKDGELTAIVYNRSSEIMTIDNTQSFFVNSDGISTSYFDPTVKAVSSTDLSSKTKGISVNLGSIASAFGVGGVVGDIASGINISGSGTKGQAVKEETLIADQPQVSVAPNSTSVMSKVFKVAFLDNKAEDKRKIVAPMLELSESPYRFSVCISYSFDGGKTYDRIMTEFYVDSYFNIPLKEEGKVNQALCEIEQNKSDMYNVPWYLLDFKNKIANMGFSIDTPDQIFTTGTLYDYQ